MLAVELETPELAAEVVQQAFQRGLLLLTCGKKAIRFSPPLVIVEEEAELAASLFAEALEAAG
jgi:4-aminobutyrate aminotransferase